MRFRPLLATVLGLALLCAGSPQPSGGADASLETEEAVAGLPSPEHRAWLDEVALLITPEERELFLALNRDYQRERFIERFWEVRDPFPETAHNELREAWAARAQMARKQLGGIEGDRARAMLLAGPPRQIRKSLCHELLREVEIWTYAGTGGLHREFQLVFVLGAGGGGDRYRFWSPADGLRSLLSWHHAGPVATEDGMRQRIAAECINGREVLMLLEEAIAFGVIEEALQPRPRGGTEWIAAFAARSTDLPSGAESFAAEVRFAFPGRNQSRTVVQGLISIPLSAAGIPPRPDGSSYSLRVDGEILRGEDLFDHFRYRFDLPAGEVEGDRLPLVVQRFLRPGPYVVLLRVEDLTSGRFFRAEGLLEVPLVEPAARAAVVVAEAVPEPLRPPAAETPAPAPATGPPPPGPEPAKLAASPPAESDPVHRLLGEANRDLDVREHTVKIHQVPERLLTGKLRVEAATSGEGIAKVAFNLDGRPVLSKTRPPFSVELDLGSAPRLHLLEAVAYDEDGNELARDKVPVNGGPHRFAVRLIEPQEGSRYVRSLSARAEVDLPLNEKLDRVELFLNETLIATLFQPPFVQPILLPREEKITYLKAVAYLADGNSAMDVVFINPPPQLDRIRVNFVELYTSVTNRRGEPVDGLAQEQFVVLEDGVEQEIRRFERVYELPIHAGVVLDTSTSMTEELREAEKAALTFFERVIQPKDRAAVVVFNDQPVLRAPLTNNLEILAGGLAEISAEGETALYDSLVYSLFYFSGLRGKRALIVLSDGEDSKSRYGFDETLEFARRSGVAIYIIALNPPSKNFEVRSKLMRLAHTTGGECYFVAGARELEGVYRKIEDDLRTQYVLGYQSSHDGDAEFRVVEVRVTEPGLEARTIPGYYP